MLDNEPHSGSKPLAAHKPVTHSRAARHTNLFLAENISNDWKYAFPAYPEPPNPQTIWYNLISQTERKSRLASLMAWRTSWTLARGRTSGGTMDEGLPRTAHSSSSSTLMSTSPSTLRSPPPRPAASSWRQCSLPSTSSTATRGKRNPEYTGLYKIVVQLHRFNLIKKVTFAF